MTELVKKLVNEIEDLNDGWRDASVNPPEKIKNRYILVWGSNCSLLFMINNEK